VEEDAAKVNHRWTVDQTEEIEPTFLPARFERHCPNSPERVVRVPSYALLASWAPSDVAPRVRPRTIQQAHDTDLDAVEVASCSWRLIDHASGNQRDQTPLAISGGRTRTRMTTPRATLLSEISGIQIIQVEGCQLGNPFIFFWVTFDFFMFEHLFYSNI
jgi:hypothetical protein